MSQIFKKKIEDNKIVVDFLKTYCQNEKKNEYIFSPISYKKAEYNKNIDSFIYFLKKYYHKSKQFYLNRTTTYKNFLTILRQVCNHLCISYTSKILYNETTKPPPRKPPPTKPPPRKPPPTKPPPTINFYSFLCLFGTKNYKN